MGEEVKVRARLQASDKLILGLLAAFTAFNLSMDLYWVVYAHELAGRAGTNFFAHLYALYAPADRSYFDRITPFAWGLEGLNVFFTTLLNIWLIWAIVKSRPYRHGLQMALGAYMSYSVILYFLVAHFSGYANMPEKKSSAFLLFYGSSLPWLFGHLYLVFNSWSAIKFRFFDQVLEEDVSQVTAIEKEVRA